MIIVEGPDGVGKTTFCKKLLAHLPGHVYSHFTRLPPGFDYYWGYAERVGRGLVQDRFHMSEVAYAQARGEEPRLDKWDYRLVDSLVRRVGGVTVLITGTQELVRSRWDAGQMYDVKKTLAAAQVYEDIAAQPLMYQYVDQDYLIRCTSDRPYPTEHDVGAVLDLYRQRQIDLDRVLRRRPGAL